MLRRRDAGEPFHASGLVIPVLEYPDVPTAVKWLENAFALEVRMRIGAHRAQLDASKNLAPSSIF